MPCERYLVGAYLPPHVVAFCCVQVSSAGTLAALISILSRKTCCKNGEDACGPPALCRQIHKWQVTQITVVFAICVRGGGQVQGWKVLRDTNSISVYLSQYCWLGSAESRGLIQGARPCKPGSSLSLPSAPVFVVSPPADVVHCIAHCAVAHAIADAVAWTAYCSA